jgi:hypothetical protein
LRLGVHVPFLRGRVTPLHALWLLAVWFGPGGRPRDSYLCGEREDATQVANAVKRRCEERFGGVCGVDHRKIRRWEEGTCVPDLCHQEVICELLTCMGEAGPVGISGTQQSITRPPAGWSWPEPAVQGGREIILSTAGWDVRRRGRYSRIGGRRHIAAGAAQ